MWAAVRPLTKDTKLGKKVATTVVLNPDSPCFQEAANNLFREDVRAIIDFVIYEIVSRKKLNVGAECVILEWFRYIISYIVKNATSSPMLDSKDGEDSIISGSDINWSINSLSNEVYLQALGFTFHKIVPERLDKKRESDMIKIISPGLVDIGEHSLMKFSEKCSELFKHENSLGYHTMSSEGIFELLNWIMKISSSTMNEAEILENEGQYSAEEMIWAFNQVRINHFSNSCWASTFDAQDSNHAYDKQVTGKKSPCKKRARGKKLEKKSDLETLPCLHWDLFQSHILPKLPFDSLLRLKCVCKKFKEIITSTHFQVLLLEQEDFLIKSYGIIVSDFHKISEGVKAKKFDGLELELVEIDITSAMNVYQGLFYASCSGVLSLICASGANLILTIGNPLTGEWTTIPPPHLSDKEIFDWNIKGPGLAVNLSNNPPWYKLVVPVYRKSQNVRGLKEVLLHVFSSKTGEWKASNAVLPKFDVQRRGNSVYANGLLYWVAFAKKLCWFNLDTDVVGFIDLPRTNPVFNLTAIGMLEQSGEERRLTCSLIAVHQRVETYRLIGEHQWEKFISVSVPEWFGVKPFPYLGGHFQLVWVRKKIIAYDLRNGKRRIVSKDLDQDSVTLFAFKLNICPLPGISKKEQKRSLG